MLETKQLVFLLIKDFYLNELSELLSGFCQSTNGLIASALVFYLSPLNKFLSSMSACQLFSPPRHNVVDFTHVFDHKNLASTLRKPKGREVKFDCLQSTKPAAFRIK